MSRGPEVPSAQAYRLAEGRRPANAAAGPAVAAATVREQQLQRRESHRVEQPVQIAGRRAASIRPKSPARNATSRHRRSVVNVPEHELPVPVHTRRVAARRRAESRGRRRLTLELPDLALRQPDSYPAHLGFRLCPGSSLTEGLPYRRIPRPYWEEPLLNRCSSPPRVMEVPRRSSRRSAQSRSAFRTSASPPPTSTSARLAQISSPHQASIQLMPSHEFESDRVRRLVRAIVLPPRRPLGRRRSAERSRAGLREHGAPSAGPPHRDAGRDADVTLKVSSRPARPRWPAEREGFEPSTHLSARTRFPVALLRPLGHLSVTGAPGCADDPVQLRAEAPHRHTFGVPGRSNVSGAMTCPSDRKTRS